MPSATEKQPSSSVCPTTMAEWTSPEGRPEMIEDLVSGVDRYNPSNLPILEDYLYDQVRRGTYDAMANLATLKLYQFNPSLLNPDVLINLLLKALLAAPGADFGLAMALVGDRCEAIPLPDEEDDMDTQLNLILPFLSELYTLLRTCQYTQFWSTLNGSSEAATILRQNQLSEHPLFVPLVRSQVVSRAIASTHQRISLVLCGKWFALQGAGLDKFIQEELGWTVEEGVVRIPANEDNAVKGKTVREVVELPQLTKIIAAGSV